MVQLDETVTNKWAQVETQYQRRFDLIDNLVESVKGASNFEKDTYTAVTEARSAWSKAGTVSEKVAAANTFQSALGRLLVTVENYPNLKATQAYSELMVEISGTENRISVERKRYNDSIKDYNIYLRKFPNNLLAGMFNFEKGVPFEAKAGSEKAPKVKF